MSCQLILLFTDFGAEGPYLGQLKTAIQRIANGVDVIDLLSNAPAGDPEASAYLLGALIPYLPLGCVVLGVVDPGVGGQREALAVRADGRWFVGPDNGLFNQVAAQSQELQWNVIDWRPDRLSATFHGRDLFAPIAARIAQGDFLWERHQRSGPHLKQWPMECDRVIYFDHYGNAYTGRRYHAGLTGKRLLIKGRAIPEAETFCCVPPRAAFWYRNSIDLVEIAVNQGAAKTDLALEVGTPIQFVD